VNFFSKQFITFLITGGIAAAVNFFTRILFSNWMSFSQSIILAYMFGMATAFLLAKYFVFKNSSRRSSTSAVIFIFVNVIAVLQTWSISIYLVEYLFPTINIVEFSEEIAHGIAIMVPVFTSYIGHKKWSFRDKNYEK
jgi:putative flippase GtrA